MQFIQKALSLVAITFGLVTIVAGSRVLTGSDPGYDVFVPLLIYNTVMGIVYIAAGVTTWINLMRGKYLAGAIFTLNIIVLGIVSFLYAVESSVALESLRAMTFRTVVWFLLFLGLAWLYRKKSCVEEQHA